MAADRDTLAENIARASYWQWVPSDHVAQFKQDSPGGDRSCVVAIVAMSNGDQVAAEFQKKFSVRQNVAAAIKEGRADIRTINMSLGDLEAFRITM